MHITWVPGGDGGKLEHGGSLCSDDYFASPRAMKYTKITAKIANKIIVSEPASQLIQIKSN